MHLPIRVLPVPGGPEEQESLRRTSQSEEEVWSLQRKNYNLFHGLLGKFQPSDIVPINRVPLVHDLILDHFHHLAVDVLVPGVLLLLLLWLHPASILEHCSVHSTCNVLLIVPHRRLEARGRTWSSSQGASSASI